MTSWDLLGKPESLPAGTALSQPQPIFPRLDTKKKEMQSVQETAPVPEKAASKPVAQVQEITIEDFAKVQFRIGRVLEAVPVEGSDKLLKLDVMVGEEKRQIVAGIRKSYEPIDLIVLEGMGRALESNFDARFTCDTLKIAMIKDEGVASALDGELFDLICRFEGGSGQVSN